MAKEKSGVPGSTQMLVMRLLAERDMYGYQMIEELARRSNDTFSLKAGTLYPILHGLEQQGKIESYEREGDEANAGRPRRWDKLTRKGQDALRVETARWYKMSGAVNRVLESLTPAKGVG